MTNTPSVIPFDYQGLTDDTEQFVRSRTEEIKTLAQRSAQDIRDIGIKLLEVKGRLGHGRFGIWLKAEFGWSDRTARSFIAVADRYKTENFSDLTIAPSALYLLSAPSTPKSATDEATKRAKAGEKITHSTAKKIVAGAKRIVTPPADPITVSDPSLSWEEQYFEQIDAHPDEIVFMIPGDRATMWVAMGVTANLIAEKTGTQAYPLAGTLPGIPPIPMVCVTITDPQTGKQDSQKVDDLEELLGKRTITYVESDMHLLALLRDTEKRLIDPTPIVQAKHDREAEEAAGRKPFGAPIPRMPAPHAAPVRFPPAGWRSMVTHVESVQPAMSLIIDAPENIEPNGNGSHPEETADVTDLQRAQALYAATQREKNADRPAHPEDFEEWYINGLIQRLDEVARFQKQALQFARTDEQQHLHRWGNKQIEWGPEMANEKLRRLAAHNGALLELETDIARASTHSDINAIMSKLPHYKVGDEKLDAPVARLVELGAAKIAQWKAEDEPSEGTIAA